MCTPPQEIISALHAAYSAIETDTHINADPEAIETIFLIIADELAAEYAEGNPLFDWDGFVSQLPCG